MTLCLCHALTWVKSSPSMTLWGRAHLICLCMDTIGHMLGVRYSRLAAAEYAMQPSLACLHAVMARHRQNPSFDTNIRVV